MEPMAGGSAAAAFWIAQNESTAATNQGCTFMIGRASRRLVCRFRLRAASVLRRHRHLSLDRNSEARAGLWQARRSGALPWDREPVAVARVLLLCPLEPHYRATTMRHADHTTTHAKRSTDRRTKLRLRELCDEVVASYRQARGEELFSSDDRRTARELMASVTAGAAR